MSSDIIIDASMPCHDYVVQVKKCGFQGKSSRYKAVSQISSYAGIYTETLTSCKKTLVAFGPTTRETVPQYRINGPKSGEYGHMIKL